MAIVLNIDGTQTTLESVSRETLIHVVGGSGEAIYLDSGRYLYVRLKGKILDLQTNPQASALVPAEDYVVGTAVLCSAFELGYDDDVYEMRAEARRSQLQ